MSFSDQIALELAETYRRTGWRRLVPARLGNGAQPATVVVPPSVAQRPGLMYVHRIINGRREVYTASNQYAGIPYDNSGAFFSVMVGYPPNSDVLSIVMPDPNAAFGFTGGVLPSQVSSQVAAILTPDRVMIMKLFSNDTFVLGITGGFWRNLNILKFTPYTASFVDVQSYLPSTDMAKYLLISIDEDNTPQVTEGTEFDKTSTSPYFYMPTTIPTDTLTLGMVYLEDTFTKVETKNIIALPDLFYAPTEGAIMDTIDTLVSNTFGGLVRSTTGQFVRNSN